MIGYLERTTEKVEALMQEAQRVGLDPASIHTVRSSLKTSEFHAHNRALQAMKPILDAVEKAVNFWRLRNSKGLR